MIPWQTAGRRTRRRGVLRRASLAAVCLSFAWFLPVPAAGLQGRPRPDSAGVALLAAVALAGKGELDRAGTSLSEALRRWPDHPELLEGLAGLRLRQGRAAEAEALAGRLTRIDPSSEQGWELLAVSRYLQDDTRGALRAWSRGRPLRIRELDVRVLAHDGPRASTTGDPARLTGLAAGRSLTEGGLVRGERRLEALPAASSSRLAYRPLGGGDVGIEGTVVLGATNPFTLPAVAAHALRALVGRVHVVSSDPLGHLERWELSGTVEGTTRSVGLALSHPAPRGTGVWRWSVAHGEGRYVAAADEVVREARSGAAWSHADWVTGWLRGSAHGEIESRPGRGTFAGAGIGGTLLSLTARSSLHAEGTAWARVGSDVGGDGRREGATRFGRLALRAALRPVMPPGVSAPSGIVLQGGLVAVSSGAPHDLLPRIGAGGNASVPMRARSDIDDDGVVRPLLPGRAWAHASVELLRGVGSVGPLGIGLAAFADGVRVLASASAPGSNDPTPRRGAIHLGAGVRARIPGVAGWLRADWGVDPVDGASRLSAAWVGRGASW